ncbi:uncharacterized protein LOC119082388 [Bradysia coprophila]|uniref:uncharacterized protein LOC119082388 n=1 Tax=Bradysia coprophila TaxID=38358 RepID=UPI00187D785D|nr:uncharacterized protein LOC119082388 [Bradysia coprophila]
MGSAIESWLNAVANAPGLSDDYVERGKTCISKIVQMLKRKSGLCIRRHFIGGSVGKSTTTTTSDFDCYIFIDDIEYPFKNVLKDIGSLIRQNQPIGGRFRIDIAIESPTVLTCVVYECGEKLLNLDISIAKNYATTNAIQHKKTLDAIKPWPSKIVYKMNGGLSSTIVQYVRQQNDFTRSMIRLTKQWYDSLNIKQSNSKIMFEILAMHCAQLENKFPTKSILRCFMGYLKMLENFEELDVVFRDEYKFPEHQFDEATTLPRVMDPVNPYRNCAEFFRSDTKILLKKYSLECAAAIKMHLGIPFQLAGNIFEIQKQQPQFPEWFSKRVFQSVWSIKTTVEILQMGVVVRKQEDFAHQPDDYHCFVVCFKDNMNEIVDRAESTELETLANDLRSFIRLAFGGAKVSTPTSNDSDDFHASIIYPIPQIGSILINVRL